MRKLITFTFLVAIGITLQSCCGSNPTYDNPNSWIGSQVLDTIPIFYTCDDNKREIHYYKYKINYYEDDSLKHYLKTLNVKIENHYFAPGDTISFDHVFKTKAKVKKETETKFNKFIE